MCESISQLVFSQRILAFNQDRSRGLRRPSWPAQWATFHNICKTSTNIGTSLHYIAHHYTTLHRWTGEQTGNEQFLDFCISTNPKIQNQKMVQIQSFTVCTEAKYMCLNFISWSHKMGFAPELYPQCIRSHPIPMRQKFWKEQLLVYYICPIATATKAPAIN